MSLNKMINYQEALSIILKNSTSFGDEFVAIDKALGRVLAEDILAERDLPPFNRSAMDGIAININDLKNGLKSFKLLKVIFAGEANKHELKSGECYKIMTGAAVPKCANLVIRIEDVLHQEGVFSLINYDYHTLAKLYQNIALKGQDLKKGAIALPQGDLITIPKIGLLASLGKSNLWVKKLPKVNVITTGNEVKDFGKQITDLHIYNSNKYVLKQFLNQNQIDDVQYSHVNDDLAELKNSISQNLNADILILTGGVSAGDADYNPEVLADLGVKQLFHKVAIKPGKPIYVGISQSGTMIFALPGNPFSCLVTFKLFIEPFIKTCLGLNQKNQFKLFGDCRKSKSNFDEFFPVRLINNDMSITATAINGSGDVRLGFSADGFAMHPQNKTELLENEEVLYFSF